MSFNHLLISMIALAGLGPWTVWAKGDEAVAILLERPVAIQILNATAAPVTQLKFDERIRQELVDALDSGLSNAPLPEVPESVAVIFFRSDARQLRFSLLTPEPVIDQKQITQVLNGLILALGVVPPVPSIGELPTGAVLVLIDRGVALAYLQHQIPSIPPRYFTPFTGNLIDVRFAPVVLEEPLASRLHDGTQTELDLVDLYDSVDLSFKAVHPPGYQACKGGGYARPGFCPQ